MGDWRHFGESLELTAPLECGVRVDCGRLPPSFSSDQGLRGDLSRLIEGEILPRLMLAHREKARPARRPANRHPTQEQIDRFSALLLDPMARDVTAQVMGFLDEGLSLDTLLLELLVPSARNLGVLWEEDACDFMDVTVGVGRLQALARELCARLERQASPGSGRSILLLPCPGETHTFCLSIVASFFREAGWDVATAGTGPRDELVDLVHEEWFDVVGVSLSCDVLIPAMSDIVRDLRKASCNRSVRILVGGPLFDRYPEQVHLVGADAVATDGRIAPHIAESLLEMRARAC